jgi:hypothetical protein
VNQLGWNKTSKHNKHRIISQLLAEWGWVTPINQEAPGPVDKMGEILPFLTLVTYLIWLGIEMETAHIFLLMREGDGLAPILKTKNYTRPTFNIIPAKPLPGKEKAEGEIPDPSRSILQVTAPKITLERFADLARIRRSVSHDFYFSSFLVYQIGDYSYLGVGRSKTPSRLCARSL